MRYVALRYFNVAGAIKRMGNPAKRQPLNQIAVQAALKQRPI
jgi:UDP-glucose 4-epimerase